MSKPAASLAIFRAGTHTASDGKKYTFSESDLQAIASGYSPAISEAPLVVGHPKTDDPAYGWAESLEVRDSVLWAAPQQVEPQFAEMVNKGLFKKISASVYLPDTPGNPTPGKPYLRHIGFLGAQPPAVKGLPSAQFADGDGALEFAQPLSGLGWALTDILQRLRDYFVERDGAEAADRVIPQWQIRSIDEYTSNDSRDALSPASYAAPTHDTPEFTMSEQNNAAQFAEREQQLNTQAQQLEERERALQQRETQARRDDAAEFAEGLVKDGKLLPRHQAPVVELLLALPTGAPLNFAEGDQQVQKPADTVLRELLSSLPKQVDFSEKSGGGDGVTGAVNFAAPSGSVVDGSRMELHNKAVAYQQQHAGVDYLAAVKAVGG